MLLVEPLKSLARYLLPEAPYRRYRQAKVSRLVARYERRVVQHDYCGVPLRVVLTDPLAEGWYDSDWLDEGEITLARTRLNKGDRVFDIGSHQGIVAMILADVVGPSGQVIAVEAEPHNVMIAAENFTLNGCHNVTLVAEAIDERSGDVLLAQELNAYIAPGNRWGKVRVRATTIDELAGQHGHPDLVLLDVEGYELKALKGAIGTLSAGCTLIIELHVGAGLERSGGSADEVLGILRTHGYTILRADADGRLQPVVRAPTTRVFLIATPPST